jgi:hypothetical protein
MTAGADEAARAALAAGVTVCELSSVDELAAVTRLFGVTPIASELAAATTWTTDWIEA